MYLEEIWYRNGFDSVLMHDFFDGYSIRVYEYKISIDRCNCDRRQKLVKSFVKKIQLGSEILFN